MDPYSQEYMDMQAYVASLTPEVKKAMVESQAQGDPTHKSQRNVVS
jgi:hypothetical protein